MLNIYCIENTKNLCETFFSKRLTTSTKDWRECWFGITSYYQPQFNRIYVDVSVDRVSLIKSSPKPAKFICFLALIRYDFLILYFKGRPSLDLVKGNYIFHIIFGIFFRNYIKFNNINQFSFTNLSYLKYKSGKWNTFYIQTKIYKKQQVKHKKNRTFQI